MNRQEAFDTLAAIEEELAASRFALGRTLRNAQRDPTMLHTGHTTVAGLQLAARNVEVTYTVRLFAAFEGTLRDFWSTFRSTNPLVSVLMDRIGARAYIQADWLQDAHEVREFRNELMHEHQTYPRLSFGECRSRLCRFLSGLPVRWS